jgi:hypothetical protein
MAGRSRNIRLTSTQCLILRTPEEPGALELTSLMNTILQRERNLEREEVKRSFSAALAYGYGSRALDAGLVEGVELGGDRCEAAMWTATDWRQWAATPASRFTDPPDLGRYVEWDDQRLAWRMRLDHTESPEVHLTEKGLAVIQ